MYDFYGSSDSDSVTAQGLSDIDRDSSDDIVKDVVGWTLCSWKVPIDHIVVNSLTSLVEEEMEC